MMRSSSPRMFRIAALSSAAVVALLMPFSGAPLAASPLPAAEDERVAAYVAEFNRTDAARDLAGVVPNARAASWIVESAPRLECPSPLIERIY